MGGKPFQSKLIPHAAVISAQRRRGRTWREIAAHLTEAGCSTDPGSLCRFFARWKRRPYALGAEPETEGTSVPPAAAPASAAASLRPSPASAPALPTAEQSEAAADLTRPAAGAPVNPWGV